MATSLSKATSFVRKALIVFGIITILSILIQIFASPGLIIPTPGFPGIVPTGFKSPDNALGKIPHARLTSFTLAPNTKAKYALDGKLSGFPGIVNAYSIEKPRELLGNSDRSRRVATILGFNTNETRTEGNVLIWEVPSKTRIFTYDKVLDKWNLLLADKDFAIQLNKGLNPEENFYNNNSITGVITRTLQIPNQYFANAQVNNYLINLLPSGSYQGVLELEQAKFIKSSVYKRIASAEFLFPQNPEQAGVYSEIRKPEYLNGVANLVLQGKLDNPKEDIISFSYHDYQYDKKGIYQALSVEEAYNNIQLNKGILYWLHLKDENVYQTYQELNVIEFRINVAKIGRSGMDSLPAAILFF